AGQARNQAGRRQRVTFRHRAFLCGARSVIPVISTCGASNQMSKRALLAATAMLFISTAAASAIEINCGAPRVALGDEPDSNPVVSVDIRYIPEDHAWRIFHNRRDGLVVSRSEQYAIQDASNDRKAQWQGSLNRQCNLYMIGEVRRGPD